MQPEPVDLDEGWQRGFQTTITELAVNRIRCELAEHGPDRGLRADVNRLTILMLRVAEHVNDLEPALIGEFLTFALDVIVRAGAGSGFALTDEFVGSSRTIIESLARRDRPVTDLLLAEARYHAVFSTAGARRREAITRAIQLSRTPEERINATLTLALLHIDISAYDKARRMVNQCAAIAHNAGLAADFAQDLLLITGLSHFYSDLDLAERYLRAVTERDEPARFPELREPVGTARHYLARIAQARGQYQLALDTYVAAQPEETGLLGGLGFYHLRLAEVLLDHGPLTEAAYHLHESQRIFTQGQQFQTAATLLDGAWARYFTHLGDHTRADLLLSGADELARRDGHVRGELVLLVQLARLRLHQHRPISAGGLLIRSGWIFLRDEAQPNWWHAPRQLLTSTRTTMQLLHRGSRRRHLPDPVHCPCGANHAGDEQDLSRRQWTPPTARRRRRPTHRRSSGKHGTGTSTPWR